MSGSVSIPLLGFTLLIKLRISDFESHWNILIFFDKKRHGVRFEYAPFPCLVSLESWNSEISILKVIKIL